MTLRAVEAMDLDHYVTPCCSCSDREKTDHGDVVLVKLLPGTDTLVN